MLSRLTKSLMRTSRLFYSTAEKKNVVVIPKHYQLNFMQYEFLRSAIETAPTCKCLSGLIKDNLELFSDRHIEYLFNQIGRWDLEIDETFHTVISPIAIEWVKTFNRQNAPALNSILLTLTFRNIQSPELEKAVVAKLDEENIYRYLDLQETVALFLALSKHPRYLKHSLFNKLQKVIYQQKAYYAHHPNLLAAIREGMAAVEKELGEKPAEIPEAYKQIV